MTDSIRLGLCCIFRDEPIKFRNTTVTYCKKLTKKERYQKLADLCRTNAVALQDAFQYCVKYGIGCFRVNSQILPVKTHVDVGYELEDLPGGEELLDLFQACGEYAREQSLRVCFHPDQFVVMNSPREEVVERSILELEYQSEVAEWIGADVVNIHGGGAYGDKTKALDSFAKNLDRLSARVRSRLTVENDDVTYTPEDLLPLCRQEGIPLVYDAHHHRCNQDDFSVEEATTAAIKTWNREPLFHLSSPIEGWEGKNPRRHHDFIDLLDFPDCWRPLEITVEVEAKAKELAVLRLQKQLKEQWYVYLLRCADDSLYTGITNDSSRRLAQHQSGKASRYTRSRLPVAMVYREPQKTKGLALQRELTIKSYSRQKKEALIKTGKLD
ncbi:UV DNA damage endonuclease [Polystyrenella longa]|uniref:UV DNA damage endonuclease n=1 Tax=Polystyrenella longa TaxID=2528007 RepID=A0A518CK77_9PLAN|nr:UV DNA damage repair endonuclease UvsE [Polystyrenella longa]QDU79617.1 UV DNA damage endonuclease [Polystyrenella longa]